MKKVKIYMVTYQGHIRLRPTLTSIFDSDVGIFDFEINIINNHTDIRLPPEFEGKVNIIHNTLRPDWSYGHLSRNWNQALVNGFRDLNNPDCDYVVCTQDDSLFHPQWASRLEDLHTNRFSFVHNGHGDQFHSYTPKAVKRVGIWDERFCGLTRQCADYMARCLMYNKDGCTINDPGHKRVHNPIFEDINKARNYLVDANARKIDKNMGHQEIDAQISGKLMLHKYGRDFWPWTQEIIDNPPKRTLCDNYITYPHFEKDVYNLREKGYII